MGVIYKIYSLKTDRHYIGSAVNFKSRKSSHLSHLRKTKHHSIKLQRHYNKYGYNDLVFYVLENVIDNNNLLVREQYYIDTTKPYFNICPIAGSNLNRKFGPMKASHKNNISKATKGIKKPYVAECLSKPIYKYDLSGNLICKYNGLAYAQRKEGLKIKPFSKINKTIGGFVWVNNISELPNFEKIREELNNHRRVKMIPIIQIDKNGNILKEYDGIRYAGRVTGIDYRSIQANASGHRKSAGGFVWKYKQVA